MFVDSIVILIFQGLEKGGRISNKVFVPEWSLQEDSGGSSKVTPTNVG